MLVYINGPNRLNNGFVKSRQKLLLVIPVKTGIQYLMASQYFSLQISQLYSIIAFSIFLIKTLPLRS